MCVKWFFRRPVLDCRGRPHASAAHFLCLTYLPQQFPFFFQQLLIFSHHRIDPFLLLKTTKGRRQDKDIYQSWGASENSVWEILKAKRAQVGYECETLCERLEASARSFSSFWMVESLWAVAFRKTCLACDSLLLCWLCFSLYFLVRRSEDENKRRCFSVIYLSNLSWEFISEGCVLCWD